MIENVEKGNGLGRRLQKFGLFLSILLPVITLGAGVRYRIGWMERYWPLVSALTILYLAVIAIVRFSGKDPQPESGERQISGDGSSETPNQPDPGNVLLSINRDRSE